LNLFQKWEKEGREEGVKKNDGGSEFNYEIV
jgi:hypothetical protein